MAGESVMIVMTRVANDAQAGVLIDEVLRRRLAVTACRLRVPRRAASSDAVSRGGEAERSVQIEFRTARGRQAALRSFLGRHHPESQANVTQWSIGASRTHAAWVRAETTDKQSDR